MFTRGGIFIRNPRLRFIDPPENPGGSGGNPAEPAEPKFPANTPVKEMTPEQQAAYWQDKARKHEDRVKAYGDITPEKLAELQQEAETLRAKNLTAEEKAVEEAKEAGRAEVRAELARERVRNALERALEGRIPNPSALLDLDRSQFVDGDKANTDAIKAWVEANSTEATAPKQFPNLFQGPREQIKTTDRATGIAEAEKRFGKKS